MRRSRSCFKLHYLGHLYPCALFLSSRTTHCIHTPARARGCLLPVFVSSRSGRHDFGCHPSSFSHIELSPAMYTLSLPCCTVPASGRSVIFSVLYSIGSSHTTHICPPRRPTNLYHDIFNVDRSCSLKRFAIREDMTVWVKWNGFRVRCVARTRGRGAAFALHHWILEHIHEG
ncbi:hypothetical protein PENSPDRAFT_300736 [Peniophora sp. CONT]|nr:hypothetical protein PENSPDRAFT_300736 [Peniophora sp. CONT]